MAVLQRHKNTIFGLNSDLAALQLADSNEASARIAGDALVQGNLDAEVTRATGAESTLQSNITAEETRALAAEGVLQTNITAEETRALAAEGVLQTNITAEITRATGAEATLQSNITAETTRATGAEATLQSNIDAEILARQTEDVALDARLDIIEAGLMAGVFWKASFDTLADLELALSSAEATTEAGWAYYVKATNDGYVVVPENDGDYVPASWANKSLIKFADYTEVSGLVSAETTRALAAEGVLTTNLNAEIARATAAEGVLTADLSAEVSRATAAEGVLTANLSAEVSRATAAEGVLTTNLNAEIARATAAEATKLSIASNLSDLADIPTARTNLDVYSKSETNTAIAQGGAEGILESVVVTADKISLSYAPKNGMILNFATVRHVDANLVSWDIPVIVDATDPSGKTFTLSPDASGQFDGKSVLVQYFYVNL